MGIATAELLEKGEAHVDSKIILTPFLSKKR